MELYADEALTTMKVKCTKDRRRACPAIIGNKIIPSMDTGSENPNSGPHLSFSCAGGIFIFK